MLNPERSVGKGSRLSCLLPPQSLGCFRGRKWQAILYMVNLTPARPRRRLWIGWKQGQRIFGGAASVSVTTIHVLWSRLRGRLLEANDEIQHSTATSPRHLDVARPNNVREALRRFFFFCVCEMFSTAEMKLSKVRACEVSIHLGTRPQWRTRGPVVQRCLVLFLDPDDRQFEQMIIKDAHSSSVLNKVTT